MDEITDKQRAFLEKHGVKVSYGMSKQEASRMIDELINPLDKAANKAPYSKEIPAKQTDREFKPKFDTSSYYVSYAKDLCIAMIEHQAVVDDPKHAVDVGTLMAQAIMCIKQAQEEFR